MNNRIAQKLKTDDFVMALQEMGTFMDVSVDDLMQLHKITEKYAQMRNKEGFTADELKNDYVTAIQEIGTFVDITINDLIRIEQKAEKYARMRERENILVEKLMTSPVITIQHDSKLSEAAHLLVTKRISGLPVVDNEKKIIGIITEADFLRVLGVPSQKESHNVWETLEKMFANPPRVRESGDLVSDLMVKNVITATPPQTLHEVLNCMKENQIKRLVVCDESRHVVGMITRSDLVRLFFDHFPPVCRELKEG